MQHNRRSIRLPGYDYAQAGIYFVTICTHQRTLLFGQITDGEMHPSDMGVIAEQEWVQTAQLRPSVELDAYIIMPNHMHGLLVINDEGTHRGLARQGLARQGLARQTPTVNSPQFGRPVRGTVGTIIGAYKSAVSRRLHRLHGSPEHPIWQRNYYEHIIRDQADMDRIRAYIDNNPALWSQDALFSS